jgi:hypothetical protein
MIYVTNGSEAMARRRVVPSPGTGVEHWGTEFFGPRYAREPAPGPQAVMTEMAANEHALAHFHGVTQFQIFPAGSGMMGKREIRSLMVQFKDHHTAYGPIVAGPQGLSFISLRVKIDESVPVYVGRPGAREKLKPSKRRNIFSAPVPLSTEPVLKFRKEAAWEPLFEERYDDGLHCHLARLGAGMSMPGPDPRAAGGYYLFVANGELDRSSEIFPLWSMVVVDREEPAFEIKAGPRGLEAVVMQFPIEA